MGAGPPSTPKARLQFLILISRLFMEAMIFESNSSEHPTNPPQQPRLVLPCKFMFPNAENAPASLPQRLRHNPIA